MPNISCTALLIRRRRVTVAPATPIATGDPDFLIGCTHTVALDIDLNWTGTTQGDHGQQAQNFQPVANMQAVQCRVCFTSASLIDYDMKPGTSRFGVVLFPVSIYIDRRNRMRWNDPARGGRPTVLMPIGATWAERSEGADHHWCVRFSENPS